MKGDGEILSMDDEEEKEAVPNEKNLRVIQNMMILVGTIISEISIGNS